MTTHTIIYRAKSTSDIKADAYTSLTNRNAYNTSELLSNESDSSCNTSDKSKRKDAFGTPILKKHGQHRVSFADDFDGRKDVLCGNDNNKNKKKGKLKKCKSVYVYSQESIHIKCNNIIPICEDITKNETKYTIVTRDIINKKRKMMNGDNKVHAKCEACCLF